MNAATPWHETMESAEARLRAAEMAQDTPGAIAAATDAVTTFRAALDLAPVARAPRDWAETQTRMSVALRLLGALVDDVDLLHDAIRSAQAALSVAPLAIAPQVWARARAALGSIYVVLGERDADLAALAEAAASYAEAIDGFPRGAFPRDWARMMRNRGAALSLLGEVANDPDALIDAIGCYRAALRVYEATATSSRPASPDSGSANPALPDGVPSDEPPSGVAPLVLAEWALTQSNLGQALRLLGEHADTPNGSHYLREAVAACEAALTATTHNRTLWQATPAESPPSASAQSAPTPQGSAPPESAPQEWAMTTTNLANALAALGDRTGDPEQMRRAIAAYRQALPALAGARWLRQRAITRHNLTLAERRLAAWEATGA
jgi:tetratricopeptide (TPR) repeat protein